MTAVADLADSVGTVAACAALGVSRAAVYRKRSPVEPKPQPRPASPRALNAEERQAVLDALHSTNHPDFPDRFESFDHALDCGRRLIDWYTNHHRHMNLGLLTPTTVHSGATERIFDQRRVVLEEAYAQHPERSVRGIPKRSRPAAEVWINPPEKVAIPLAIQLPHDTHFVTQVSQSH